MNERTIWILRIAAVFVLLLLAYLMMNLYAKLRRMQNEETRANLELRLPHEARSADIV